MLSTPNKTWAHPKKCFGIFTIFFYFFFLSYSSFAQLTPYTWPLDEIPQGTAVCNEFKTAVGLNSFNATNGVDGTGSFQSIYGAPTLSPYGNGVTPTNGIQLDTYYSLSDGKNYGTEFSIKFAFKQGYTYTVNINGTANINQPSPPYTSSGTNTLTLRYDPVLDDVNTSTACGDNGTFVFNPVGGAASAQLPIGTSSNFTTFSNILTFNCTANNGYLYVAANLFGGQNNAPGATSVTGEIYIRSLTIYETPNFAISPTSFAQTCGNTYPAQTFTVINVGHVANVTSYVWTLGANNGWIYNGVAAPATITTTTPSLTLTPTCGAALSPVTVSVYVSGALYIQQTCQTSKTSPTYSIAGGVVALCSGSRTYSITNLICNATVAWTVTPAGIVSTTSLSAPTITITKTGTGEITIKATVTSSCSGVTAVPQLSVPIGAPAQPTGLYLVDVSCPEYDFACNPPLTGITFSWSYYNATTHVLTPIPGTSSAVKTTFTTTGSYNVGVAAQNGCGVSTSDFITVNVTCATGGSGGHSIEVPATTRSDSATDDAATGLKEFTIYPNPAKDQFVVDIGATNSKLTGIKKVTLYNVSGVSLGTFEFNTIQRTAFIHIPANMASGIYIVKVFDGNASVSKKVILLQ